MARTVARQLGLHMIGPQDGEMVREGRNRAQTRQLNQETAVGLIGSFGPNEEGEIVDGLLAVQQASGEPGKLPVCPVQELGPEPSSYSVALSSEYWDIRERV